MDALIDRSLFQIGDGITHLRSAAQSLLPLAVLDQARRYLCVRGGEHAGDMDVQLTATKSAMASLMGAQADDLAFVGSTSDAICTIYDLIDWQAGDNVVLVGDSIEFPSVTLPAERLHMRNVEVRQIEPEDWRVNTDAVGGQLNDRTRLVFVSLVSYHSGMRLDLEALAEVVRRYPDAWLAIDASQALGVIPIDATLCDFLVSTVFKWTLGPHGAAVLYWNAQRNPNPFPRQIGWHSVIDDQERPAELKPTAARFEAGNPPYLPAYLMCPGLELLNDVGMAATQAHSAKLGGHLIDALDRLGYSCVTPRQASERAGIVSWLDDRSQHTSARLAEHGVLVSGSIGRVRVGLHVYNNLADVDHLVDILGPAAR
jgi:cysteine desulfurase/selenocysteine lyase